MKTIYITESQQAYLIQETKLDYERIETVLNKLKSYGYQKVALKLPNGIVKNAIVPTNTTGAFLKNKSGVITKTFDDLFFLLQTDFKNSLTSDRRYRDEIIKHVIAHWAFPDKYQLWMGPGQVNYVDQAGNPLFNLV